ncbi:MAG: glycosyltransferase family 39 protein [Anaerolineales bacterium]|nr:glycosyltransferase family 39 protein [Anaerolineales bacterium]
MTRDIDRRLSRIKVKNWPGTQNLHVWILAILFIAFALRVFGLALYPFNGDEYETIAEIKQIGLNWQSMAYSVPMHFWRLFGSGEFWLRIPSAYFGMVTVALLYRLTFRIAGVRAAMISLILAATSPFNVYHSQDLRFYALFILASTLMILATLRWRKEPGPASARLMILCGLLVCLSHFLGILAFASILIVAFLSDQVGNNSHLKSRWVFVAALWLIGAIIPLIPGVLPALWQWYRSHANAALGGGPEIIPISYINLAKILIAFFIFQFGYHVYPLSYSLIIPGLLLSAGGLLLGFISLYRKKMAVLPVVFAAMLITVYTLMDSVGGRLARGVTPRHVSFIWPVFLLVIAVGLASLPRRLAFWSVGALVLVQLFSLLPRWNMGWSYNTLIDYRRAGQFVEPWIKDTTAILYDGRSIDPVKLYFPSEATSIGYWPYLEKESANDLAGYDPLIFVTNDYLPERRLGFDKIVNLLDDEYVLVDGRVEYPLVEIVLVRRDGPFSPSANSIGQLVYPLNYYGLEFQDLSLPIDLSAGGLPIHIVGAIEIPEPVGKNEREIPVPFKRTVDRLVLVSSVLSIENLSGIEIAEIEIAGVAGNVYRFPIRIGQETQAWNSICGPQAACETIYRWHKRIALVGQYSYPGAWRDFQAGMHAVAISLPESTTIDRLIFRSLSADAPLYIWAIALPHAQ